MGVWTDSVVPRLTDRALRGPEFAELRTRTCEGLAGRVLEVGFGSGLNVDFYPPTVTSVHAVEPSDAGWELSSRRRAESRVPVRRSGLDGQRLAEPDSSFDAALSTFTLCTIPDAGRALSEIARVLLPGGSLHFLEHGLAPDPSVARWQHRLDPVQRRVFGGCHLSRDITDLITRAGLRIEQLDRHYLDGPRVGRPWTHLYLGRAVRMVP
ncbi:Methyltransferase type 11 [metagenome]|uniref:Methyltransferase type 11 n=1 Tax=metagenome TaxID=256318 RepID=A0A2P2CDE1_9ZZZZ